MSELATLLVQLVTNAGGETTYPQILEQVPPEDRRNIPRAMREARGEGALHQQMTFADGENIHYIRLGAKPVQNP